MATAPDADVVAKLTGSNGLTSSTNLFRGPVRAPATGVPHKCVFCLATGGFGPEAIKDDKATSNYCHSVVQIRVRSDVQDFDGGQTLCRGIRDTLHKATVSGYVDVRVRESEPNYLGADEQGHHEWSLNVDMEHRR